MIEKFKSIFAGLDRAYGVTIVEDTNGNGTKIKGKSFVKRQPVTDSLWQKHLDGEENLGIIPINDDNQCKWGCIDIDSYAGFDHKKLIDKIKNMKLPLIVCRSKSGGAHIFLFTSDYVSAKLMRDKLVQIKAVLGYGGSEVFPKQTELKSKDDTGNFLNLPYFNYKNSVRYAFKKNGEAATLDDFFNLHTGNYLDPDMLQELEIERPKSEYSDGPPCIETLAMNKIGEGGRNNALFHYGVYAKQKWPAEWKSKLILFNATAMEKPLSDSEVQIVVTQHDKKEWGYKCKDEPMCSMCDKTLCRTRKYGIGQEILFPGLTDLQVIDSGGPLLLSQCRRRKIILRECKILETAKFISGGMYETIKKQTTNIKRKRLGYNNKFIITQCRSYRTCRGITNRRSITKSFRRVLFKQTSINR